MVASASHTSPSPATAPRMGPTCLYRKDWLSNSRLQNRNFLRTHACYVQATWQPQPTARAQTREIDGDMGEDWSVPSLPPPGPQLTIPPSVKPVGGDSRAFWEPQGQVPQEEGLQGLRSWSGVWAPDQLICDTPQPWARNSGAESEAVCTEVPPSFSAGPRGRFWKSGWARGTGLLLLPQ